MASRARAGWLRFDLRFLLFWVMPYVAIVFALLRWHGPYVSDFLNDHARQAAAIGFTLFWVMLWASRKAGRRASEERNEEGKDIGAP